MSESAPSIERFLSADSTGRALLVDEIGLDALLTDLETLLASDADKTSNAAAELAEFALGHNQPGEACRALRTGTTAHAYLGRNTEAITMSQRAREIAMSAGHATEAARALVAGMHPLCKSGRIEEAVTNGGQARTELLEAGEDMLAARVDLNLGNVLKAQGDAQRALEHLDRVLEVLPADDPIRPHALNAVGECRYILDDHAGADDAFRETVERLGDAGGLLTAIAVGNRADVAAREGRLQEALDLFTDARERCNRLDADNHVARLVVESAEALETGGLYDEAISELESALPTLEKADLAYECARAEFAIGRIHLRRKRYDPALQHLNRAALRFTELGNLRLANRVLLAIVETSIATNRLDDAAVRLAMVARGIDGRYDEALHAHHQGMLLEAEGRLEEALAATNRACKAARPLDIRPLQIDLEARRTWLLQRTGDIQEAIESGRRATEEAEKLRGGFQVNRLRAAFLASRIAAHESYVTALLASREPANIRLAFEVVERARSRGLVERISQHLSGADIEHPNDAEISEMRKRLNVLYASLAQDGLEDQRRIRSDQRQREIDSLEIRLDRRMLELERKTPAIDAPISLGEIESALATDTALIEYFVAGNDLVAFTLLDGRLDVNILVDVVGRVDELVTELHFQCRRRLRGEPGPHLEARMLNGCREILKSIHDLVVTPLPESVRSAGNWLVVPHGALVATPFHALHDGEQHLIDRITIATAPSAAAAVRLGSAVARGEGTLVATVGDELAPAIRDEGDEVASMHGMVTRLDDTTATVDRVKAALNRARIAHIACHGRFLAGSPRSSGLRLSDRWLTVRDIHELAPTPEIVILSGCETGLQPRDGANELLGLTRGFAAGGSRAVVASLWSVHDAASTRLMTDMHRQLADPTDDGPLQVSEALRSAQLELREQHPHPAFWAPFFCAECPPGQQAVTGHRSNQGVLQR